MTCAILCLTAFELIYTYRIHGRNVAVFTLLVCIVIPTLVLFGGTSSLFCFFEKSFLKTPITLYV